MLCNSLLREYTRLSKAPAPKIVKEPLPVPKDFPAGKKLAATDGVIKQRFDEMKKLQDKLSICIGAMDPLKELLTD
ncbi:hypothetical protein [Pedobacter gandavensis]|uniref:hypothetical protein n=1 Tax=Pedobacter gandavensis TaxID=2679963 RepID=UPI0029308CCC|nr:hypothetical protein [Pedobacter gandavensis]